jgi:hypothetical protein
MTTSEIVAFIKLQKVEFFSSGIRQEKEIKLSFSKLKSLSQAGRKIRNERAENK